MKNRDLSKLRKNYNSGELIESNLSNDPIKQFEIWLEEAVKNELHEPNAMVLSTISENLKPSSRVVLLKKYSEKGFVFFTNYSSRKGNEISLNSHVALVFYWPELQRQIRIEGTTKRISSKESDDYFNSRPQENKAGAVASKQSAILDSYTTLIESYKLILKDKKLVRPKNWGGYLIKPELIEFWQGRPNRLHDRIQFTKMKSGWRIERLFP